MPLDIVIFKQRKEKEYVSIDEKLHQLMFSQDAIKQGRCRELSKIKDYYLTDVIFKRKLRIKSKTTKNNVISSYKED